MDTLVAVPIELRDANAFVEEYHRHHLPVHRDKFRLACVNGDGNICGVIQVARPVSRMLDDGFTVEVVRCCTDGTRNACSFLYSKAARIAKEMGYKRIITYILQSELGCSLKASGWYLEKDNCGGGSWDVPSRRRTMTDKNGKSKYPTEKKQRWCKELQSGRKQQENDV